MELLQPDAENKARRYLGDDGELRLPPLGAGTDGIVYATSRPSAIKVFESQRIYGQELAAYRRLAEHGVESICGHAVPRLLGWSNPLLVIEMTVVRPPYVLDFAKTRLDQRIDYPDDAMAEWRQRIEDLFDDRWPIAIQIYNELFRRYGIHYDDLKPGNVTFIDDESEGA